MDATIKCIVAQASAIKASGIVLSRSTFEMWLVFAMRLSFVKFHVQIL